MTDRVSRCGLVLWVVACGGVPFVGVATSGADAGPVVSALDGDILDAEVVLDASPGLSDVTSPPEHDAAPPPADSNAPADANMPETALPCTSKPPITVECGTGPTLTYPTSVCLSVGDKLGYTYESSLTPTACNSWCTFTCSCLAANNVCPAGDTPNCQPNTDGTIVVACQP